MRSISACAESHVSPFLLTAKLQVVPILPRRSETCIFLSEIRRTSFHSRSNSMARVRLKVAPQEAEEAPQWEAFWEEHAQSALKGQMEGNDETGIAGTKSLGMSLRQG
jgi:hypothetical protein